MEMNMTGTLLGTTGNDTLWGNGGLDRILAGDGNDFILGDGPDGPHPIIPPEPWVALPVGGNVIDAGIGRDTIFAGYGTDTVHGSDGADLIVGWGVLTLSSPYRADYARDADGADTLRGNAGDDTIMGGGGADLLDGGSGSDRLMGGVGADTLIGGTGVDRFVFGELDAHRAAEVVADFTTGEDHLDFVAFAQRLPGVSNDVLADTSFTDPTHLQVRSVIVGGNTRVEIHLPTTNSLGVDATITLLGLHHMTAADAIFA
jgi:Ca2+-binding RTX toxin-like protein